MTEREFRGLDALAAAAGRKFHRGVLLYAGRSTVGLSPKMSAVPLNALWEM